MSHQTVAYQSKKLRTEWCAAKTCGQTSTGHTCAGLLKPRPRCRARRRHDRGPRIPTRPKDPLARFGNLDLFHSLFAVFERSFRCFPLTQPIGARARQHLPPCSAKSQLGLVGTNRARRYTRAISFSPGSCPPRSRGVGLSPCSGALREAMSAADQSKGTGDPSIDH